MKQKVIDYTMNEAHYTYKVDGTVKSEWATSWGNILAKYPSAILINQIS